MRRKKKKKRINAPLSYDELNEHYKKLLENHQKLATERDELRKEIDFLKGNSVRPESFITNLDLTGEISYIKLIKFLCSKLEKGVIIFCEGGLNSLDYEIYSVAYDNAIVFPIGSWKDVESTVKKFRQESKMFYGIIDKDRRNKKMASYLRTYGVYTLGVTAIENLLALDNVILTIMKSLKISRPKTRLKSIKKEAFSNLKKIDQYYNYNLLIELTDENVLLFYPPKQVISLIASHLEISENQYTAQFKKLLKGRGRTKILNAIRLYLPKI